MSLPTANLQARYIAGVGCWSDDGVTPCQPGDLVYRWDDQSGNGHHWRQATAANRPVYALDESNRPVVRFPQYRVASGSQYQGYMACSTLVVNTRSHSLWFAGRPLTSNTDSSAFGLPGQTKLLAEYSSSGNGVWQAAGRITDKIVSCVPSYYGQASGSDGISVWTSLGTYSGTAVTSYTSTSCEIGRYSIGYWYGEFYEIDLYSAKQGTSDQQATRDYLVAQYSLQTTFDKQLTTEGDSITAGNLVVDNQNWNRVATAGTNWHMTNWAISGATVATAATRAPRVDGHQISGYRNVLLVLLGRNDFATLSAADYYSALVTYVQARVAAGWEVWLGTVIQAGSTEAKTIEANQRIRGTNGYTGIKADAGVTRIVDFGADPRFDTAADSSNPTYYADTVHPTAAGAAAMANIVKPHLAESGVTVSGPSSGAVGQASTAFTVSRAAGTFNGVDSVTLTVTDGTITATATGGTIDGNGSSSVTVRPADGQSTFTFVYEPASSGDKSIAISNGQDWANPAAVTYAAGGSSPTATCSPVNVTMAGASSYQFEVAYTSDIGIDATTVGDGDVVVTGPNAFSASATLVSYSDGTATYAIAIPGGWNASHNGTYTLTLQAGAVADTAANAVAEAMLQTFTVSLVPPVPTISYTTGDGAIAVYRDTVVGATGYRYRIDEGAWQDWGTELFVVLTGLTNGQAYVIEVQSSNVVGFSESATVHATPNISVTGRNRLKLGLTIGHVGHFRQL